MSPALTGSSEIQRFEHTDAIKIRDGIMIVFYPGLPHVYTHIMHIFTQLSYNGKKIRLFDVDAEEDEEN